MESPNKQEQQHVETLYVMSKIVGIYDVLQEITKQHGPFASFDDLSTLISSMDPMYNESSHYRDILKTFWDEAISGKTQVVNNNNAQVVN